MGEMISRDWVMKNLLFDVDRDVVRAAPSVDRVKIVRCRECDHCTHSVFDPTGCGFCEKLERTVQDDFFCGFAKMDGGEVCADD